MEKMKIKYSFSSICIATFTLWIFLHYWPNDSAINGIIETSGREESSLTKYQFFISSLKQSGESITVLKLFVLFNNRRDGPSQTDPRSETFSGRDNDIQSEGQNDIFPSSCSASSKCLQVRIRDQFLMNLPLHSK